MLAPGGGPGRGAAAASDMGGLGLGRRGPRRREGPRAGGGGARGGGGGAQGGGRGAAAGAGPAARGGARGPRCGRRRRHPRGRPPRRNGPFWKMLVPTSCWRPWAPWAVSTTSNPSARPGASGGPERSRTLVPALQSLHVPTGAFGGVGCGGTGSSAPGAGGVSTGPPAADAAATLPAAETDVLNLGLQTCGPSCSVPWVCPESSTGPHLAVIGLDAYLWSQQPSSQAMRQPESPAAAHAPVALSWPKVEELWAHLDVLLVASWQELTQHICAFTRALAQRPLKQYRDSCAFSFCVAGRWPAGERVARDGTGLRGVWWRQIGQLRRVSPAVADAIVTAFPSPRLLQQAYTRCSTERERLALLADLPVRTDGAGRPRRVGPDLSRRICLFLTATNPELLLDLSS
ncbi:probable crossover junction endonuclease EME2 isoform X3 [Meles meles]|uniref:probable crossover junction endonuclease EME2 isoform X3 n=1 Tax=Meles meles TaxID=9662 RepID=UPI001E69C7EB|nr:probable crossover junction endonuclease EME2 isoform X3 [Meles meles]